MDRRHFFLSTAGAAIGAPLLAASPVLPSEPVKLDLRSPQIDCRVWGAINEIQEQYDRKIGLVELLQYS